MPVGKPTVKKVGESTTIICPDCDSSGLSEQGSTCTTCNGKGVVVAKVIKQGGRVR